ncbi:hypothetical protein LTR10_014114 [Elasticomyces elasticus]|uniref:Uncharacterized protein n=1 Tax=Exophiala sideris TaxID=1016849 RepID=A0ABR0J3N4_9EURO|nr:hypothetical protein LTR10_014114 [Elasticomyces elasticus]KAK5026520.1 hypothetical protein LTS07_007454 [Exophiala sideris]KAK5033739.1 hypothetical protein LTR13_006791 [Exophiala sideris]KAK5055561.1 hypothetical protein LTR69_008394 [Exophiala sideris]KAK5180055.1 hypothetical protein LTR44_007531 [Eurotiomycetes sp. CCFEE 6388]
MTALDYSWPSIADMPISTVTPDWKSSRSASRTWTVPAQLIDQDSYNASVLRLGSTTSEDDLDDRIALEAQSLDLLPVHVTPDIDSLTSSLSSTTVTSESINHSSIQSQSTAPTSCASSEHRPATRSSYVSERSPTHSEPPSSRSQPDKKRNSPLKRGFRKMTGFRKRRSGSVALTSSTLSSISSDADTNQAEEASVDMRSPLSIKSSKSSWSQPPSATKLSSESSAPVDQEAVKRSMESKDLLNLRMSQLEEKARFLEFQTSLISQLAARKEQKRSEKRIEHDQVIAEQIHKNDRAIEALEARQLEEEMKMQKEQELEKRAVLIRLRHMEAYCHNPTPPPTLTPSSGPDATGSAFPSRKVTDKDYHNLAQQYRERDVMDTLHASKINVLRGKQKKAVERLMARKERELENMEKEQEKEIAGIDQDFAAQEAELRVALDAKRGRLETRWKTQALIERTRLERAKGLKHAALPDVLVNDDSPLFGLAT